MSHGGRPALDVPLLIALTLGGCLTVFASVEFLRSNLSDFHTFYGSGASARDGYTYYPESGYPNLGPPTAIVGLFAPFSLLPFRLAQAVWLAVSAVSVAASLRLIARGLNYNLRQTLWLVALFTTSQASIIGWTQGQTMAVLVYPATRAWWAWRDGDLSRAAAWFGVVVALKPPLALVTIGLGWRMAVLTAATTVTISMLTYPVTGATPWLDWLAQSSTVTWYGRPSNVSAWGILARASSGSLVLSSPDGFNLGELSLLSAVLLALLWRTSRARAADTRWALATVWAVLASPLGWVYYLPVAVGGLAGSWDNNRWLRAATGVLAVPLPLIWKAALHTELVVTIGSMYALGALLLFIGLLQTARARPQSRGTEVGSGTQSFETAGVGNRAGPSSETFKKVVPDS